MESMKKNVKMFLSRLQKEIRNKGQCLKIVLFFSSQLRILTENGRCGNGSETVPLVQVRNVIDFMPQLKYMLSGMLTSDVASKRQRNS